MIMAWLVWSSLAIESIITMILSRLCDSYEYIRWFLRVGIGLVCLIMAFECYNVLNPAVIYARSDTMLDTYSCQMSITMILLFVDCGILAFKLSMITGPYHKLMRMIERL